MPGKRRRSSGCSTSDWKSAVLRGGSPVLRRGGKVVDSNELGLRERSFELQKPDGVTRVVILGDSFVMGYGVAADERVGTFLERLLRDHAHGAPGPIECLHFGVSTWNVVAECAFLRR